MGRVYLGCLNGSSQFGTGGFHQRAVESATHLQGQGTLGTGSLHQFAGFVDAFDRAGDDNLARAVVVGSHADFTFITHLFANLFHLLVRQGDDGGHCGRMGLASLLHGHGTGIDQLQTVFEGQCAGHHEGGELAEGVSGGHLGLAAVAHAEGRDNRVQEDGGLCHLGLAQVLVRAAEHQVRDAVAQDVVGFLK